MKRLLLTTIAAVLLVGCGEPSAFHKAVEQGNIEAVKQHLAAGTDVDAKDMNGWTPLHWAAWEGHKEIAELLIDKGADVYAKDEKRWTPLHLAAQGGHKEIAELLIAKRPYVDAGDYRDWTPLHWAACNSKRWAASRGHKEIVELLIAAGADVNARTRNGRGITPLDMANDRIPNVQKGDRETADLLRKHGGKTRHEL